MRAMVVAMPAAVAEQLPGIDLTAEDAARLASRGVNAELAKAAGLRRISSACAAHQLGRLDKSDLSGIFIPYVAPRELAVTHHRIWLDQPAVVIKSGKAATTEILQAVGSTNWLYFLPGTTADSLADIDLPILFCTSETDTLAALALDGQPVPLLPIGFGGVWGWRGTTPSVDPATGSSKRVHGPVEDLSRISLRGRMVMVCYPSNVDTDAEAFKARKALLSYLKKQGVRPVVLEVQPAADGSTSGLGEWIAGDGAAAVAAAIQVATASKSSSGIGYQVSEEGIFWNDPNPDKPPLFLASHFEVTACTRELDGTNWGRRLGFHDPDGNPRQLIVPMTDLAGDCTRVAEILLAHGVRVNPNRTAKERLAMYIQREPRERIFVTPRVGWHSGSFVLPERTFAPPTTEPVVYQAGFGAAHNYKVQGSLDEWRENVGRRCAGNSRLVFSVSLAFVGPLLSLVDQDPGGFHLRGLSSSGKTILTSRPLLIVQHTCSAGAGFLEILPADRLRESTDSHSGQLRGKRKPGTVPFSTTFPTPRRPASFLR